MKIIHFSDIHTGGYIRSVGAFFDKRIIGTLNYKLRRKRHVKWEYLDKAIKIIKEEKPDYIINTGDLTSVSEASEFNEAIERLKPITDDESIEFLNVPGNHDFYIKKSSASKHRLKTYNELNRNKFSLEDLPLKIETDKCTFILVDESRPNKGTNSSGALKLQDFQKIEKWLIGTNSKPVIFILPRSRMRMARSG